MTCSHRLSKTNTIHAVCAYCITRMQEGYMAIPDELPNCEELRCSIHYWDAFLEAQEEALELELAKLGEVAVAELARLNAGDESDADQSESQSEIPDPVE